LNQDEKKVKIGYYVIKPYSEADVFLTAQVDNFCELTNGDERKLTAQITGWAFE
jgi:putative sterol carrier protein